MPLKSPEYYSGSDIETPVRPTKPMLLDRDDPDQIREYADRMESYHKNKEKYNEGNHEYRKMLSKRRAELVEDLAEEHEITLGQAKAVFEVAWEDGHSSGVGEVIQRFEELVEMAEQYLQHS